MLAGGAAPAGQAVWGLRSGARADWLCLDTASQGMENVPMERWLDALVFASAGPVFCEVGVAGRRVISRT